MAGVKHVKLKSEWKKVKLDPNLFSDDNFCSLVSFEELTDYEIIDGLADDAPKVKEAKKKKKSISSAVTSLEDGDSPTHKGDSKSHTKERVIDGKVKKSKKKEARRLAQKLKKTLKRQKLGSVVENANVVDLHDLSSAGIVPDEPNKTKIENVEGCTATRVTDDGKGAAMVEKKRKRKRKKKGKQNEAQSHKRQRVSAALQEDVDSDDNDAQSEPLPSKRKTKELDMTAWDNLFVPPLVLRALEEQGFTNPTPIQQLTLPSAIRDRKDIIGAAETGSGKTLAFGIPLIHHILRLKEADAEKDDQDGEGDEEGDSQEQEEEAESDISEADDAEGGESESDVSDAADEEEDDEEEESSDESDAGKNDSDEGMSADSDASTPSDGRDDWVAPVSVAPKDSSIAGGPRLYALVLTPTRELAIQVKNHLQAVAKYTGIKIATIVGGMSQQKQERILKKHPEIVVATPGRLWELIQEDNAHLQSISHLPLLVIDEADRMVEKGHFQELSNLFEMINVEESHKKRRQNFIFSATLTYVHHAPMRLLLKKKKKKKVKSLSPTDKLDSLVSQIGLRDKPKVVDITRKVGTVDTLMEARINCTKSEKDIYLYYFLKQFPGRTLVFVNSKDCLRRLVSIMTLLKCPPLPLHADMHQRQRLKNLDRFTSNPKAILLATDVAARGLDIPNVQHVLHYQVPHTTENYIHRSGRTARAMKEGLSVMIVGPEDVKNYRKITRSLNRDKDLPLFPIDEEIMPAVESRVELARKIDVEEHRMKKAQHQNNWFKKAAEEMDIELDEDLLKDTGSSENQREYKEKLKVMRRNLNSLLGAPMIPRTFSGKYPTKSGKLVMPPKSSMENADAISRIKDDSEKHKKLIAREAKRIPVVKKKKKEKFKNRKKKPQDC